MIWDEVGFEQEERERILEELQRECTEVYKRKVDSANMSRARLHQALAESEAELTNLLLSLGERSFPGRPEKLTGTLKEQLNSITPALQEMQLRKEARLKRFKEVQEEIHIIASEIAGIPDNYNEIIVVNEGDLSMKKLNEFQNELQRLKKEKSDRSRKVEDLKQEIHELAIAMGMEPSKIISDVHPSLSVGEKSKNISDSILNMLNVTVQKLKEEKRLRMEKIQGLEKALTSLWAILDMKFEERQPFAHIKLFAASNSSFLVLSPGILAIDKIDQVEAEVKRLDQLKSSKMKELFWAKRIEVEEICKKSHMELLPSRSDMDNIMTLIVSGKMEHEELLNIMEEYMSRVQDEAVSRKEIMDKVEKWILSCDEERWLEEYSMDEKRYSVSRGAHKNLRRAERARVMVNKIPGLVEMLVEKTRRWEEERKKTFYYDEIPLLAMLEEYALLRKEKEDEKFRQKERKKVQSQLIRGQPSPISSRPSTSASRPPSSRGFNRTSSYSPTFSNKGISSVTNNAPRASKLIAAKRSLFIAKEDNAFEI
ncbi:microtubule-associated protein 8-like isoform X1 [Carex littledalei]|uniref:Microtubule-associated protein 8-like isoform X1 n=1 Tax=Carex littledalei TaxID=544730 RepID=A0A833V7L2_9POAL|nr:microtubule-associated protein 8-like isoform X1 [Carex littledalei]